MPARADLNPRAGGPAPGAPLRLARMGRAGGPGPFQGAARFDRSGVVTIPAGASSATVTKMGGGAPLVLLPGSLVPATPQTNRSGLHVQAAVPNVAKGTVTIYLRKKVSAATKVAWFVTEQTVP